MYQSSVGGKTKVPLEMKGKMIGGTLTPRFASVVSWKYAHMSAKHVAEDMGMNHHREMSAKLVQKVGEQVGHIYNTHEFEWEYDLPPMPEPVFTISFGLDGTTTPIRAEGYRETMCGTLSLYNKAGERMHTIYAACAPEYGKETFEWVMDNEIDRLKIKYPTVNYIGIADGAKCNWIYLKDKVDTEILDFYHASERLAKVSEYMADNAQTQKVWLTDACSDLKHKKGGVKKLLEEMRFVKKKQSSEVLVENITYFENNQARMDYHRYLLSNYSIGSGVTEAACKVIAKQRLSSSGMSWYQSNAENMLAIRALVCTDGRWQQFWKHYANS